jgi:nicotinate-nucleotide adenylyltransferase
MIRAVLGGSFDPFHNGHLAMVETLLRRGLADRVLVVPAQQSPHKEPPVAPAAHRLEMARRALAGCSGAEVLSREIERGGISYTVETLQELATAFRDDPLRLVLGADSLASFARWRQPAHVLELAELIVFVRAGKCTCLPEELEGRIRTVEDFAMDVSATAVRRELAAGRRPLALVPEPVLAYIAEHDLYRPPPSPGRRDATERT